MADREKTAHLAERDKAAVPVDREKTVLSVDIEKTALSSDGSPDNGKKKAAVSGFTLWDVLLVTCFYLNSFAAATTFSVLIPFFPKEAVSKGVSVTVVGIIIGIFDILIFIASPVIGILVGKFTPKWFYIGGCFTIGICAMAYGLLDIVPAGSAFIASAFVLRMVEALGTSAEWTSGDTILTQKFPTKIATLTGMMGTTMGIGNLVGPALGGALYQAGGFRLPFFVTGGFVLLLWPFSVILLTAFQEQTGAIAAPENRDAKTDTSFTIWRLILHYRIFIAILSPITGFLCLCVMLPVLTAHLEPFGLTTGVLGLFFIITPGVYGLGSPLVGLVIDKWHCGEYLTIVGDLLMMVGYLLIGPFPLFHIRQSLWLTVVSLVILGIGATLLLIPILPQMVADARKIGFPDNTQTYGIIAALNVSGISLGCGMGPIVGGALTEAVGFSWATSITVIPLFILVILNLISFVLSRRKSRPKLENETSTSSKSGQIQSSRIGKETDKLIRK
ncbi:MFS-type transporter SLC18B1-like [Lineus longissimus]|uniref:MFS-type transporter SLC18B1-like n=1 Tax=Lineus longissimus TaxID=88925 RepID=UPI00315C6664